MRCLTPFRVSRGGGRYVRGNGGLGGGREGRTADAKEGKAGKAGEYGGGGGDGWEKEVPATGKVATATHREPQE